MAVPAITAISPGAGRIAGGALVDIAGTALSGATVVNFGAVPAPAFAVLSATRVIAESPAGSGTVHVTVTTPGGTSATTSAGQFQYVDGLFTIADARAFNGEVLADSGAYSTAAILAKESEIREWFEDVCAVAFIPTIVTETLDGVYSPTIYVARHNPRKEAPRRPLTVIAASIDGVALTAGELSCLKAHPDGTLVRTDGGLWQSGSMYQDLAVSITYTHGWAAVPALIKLAALQILVTDLPGSNVPFSADRFDDGGMFVSFGRGDGFNGNWHRIPDVVKALRLYSEDGSVVV